MLRVAPMKVAIVFPPSLCLPNQLYHSLPVLAGALRDGGHEPQITDLNMRSADLLLDETRAGDLLRRCLLYTSPSPRDCQ